MAPGVVGRVTVQQEAGCGEELGKEIAQGKRKKEVTSGQASVARKDRQGRKGGGSSTRQRIRSREGERHGRGRHPLEGEQERILGWRTCCGTRWKSD